MLEIRGIWRCHMSRWYRYVLRPRIWMETSRSGTIPHIGPYSSSNIIILYGARNGGNTWITELLRNLATERVVSNHSRYSLIRNFSFISNNIFHIFRIGRQLNSISQRDLKKKRFHPFTKFIIMLFFFRFEGLTWKGHGFLYPWFSFLPMSSCDEVFSRVPLACTGCFFFSLRVDHLSPCPFLQARHRLL